MRTVKSLNINNVMLRGLAKMRFARIDKENRGEKLFAIISQAIEPRVIYSIDKDIKKEKRKLELKDFTFESEDIGFIADEIVDSVIVYAMTIGDIKKLVEKASGIFDEAMIDLIGTSYIDALRDYFRMAFEDEVMIGANFTPGISLDIEDIDKIGEILNLEEESISISEYKALTPEKSVVGFYMTYAENHPEKRGNCETCMARGYGCNLCYEGDDNV